MPRSRRSRRQAKHTAGRLPRTLPTHLLGGLLTLAAVALAAVGGLPPGAAADPPVAAPAPPQQAAAQAAPAPAAGAADPLDEAIRLLSQAARTYQQVRDYTCTMVKQERIDGELHPEHVITLMVREQPFSVYMKWHGPRNLAGQEVAYVAGRNNNKMRVRLAGLSRALGFLSIDPNDPRANQHSRHNITEAGLGNLIAECLGDWQKSRGQNRLQVQTGDYLFDNKPVTRLELTATVRSPDSYCYRSVFYLDKASSLPVRVECYDWPRPGGQPGGDLAEVYSYLNMRFNVGLTDDHFTK